MASVPCPITVAESPEWSESFVSARYYHAVITVLAAAVHNPVIKTKVAVLVLVVKVKIKLGVANPFLDLCTIK